MYCVSYVFSGDFIPRTITVSANSHEMAEVRAQNLIGYAEILDIHKIA
jgi:hypothetical protein